MRRRSAVLALSLLAGCAEPSAAPVPPPPPPVTMGPQATSSSVAPPAATLQKPSDVPPKPEPVERKAALPEVFLATIPVTVDPSLGAEELVLEVRAKDGDFGEISRRGLGKVNHGSIRLRLPEEYPASSDKPEKIHRACSFVIDCDAPIFGSLPYKQPTGGSTSIETLADFVSRYIEHKSLTRAFDIASTVAATREGDCSEHATLLTALARREKLPARVVLGLAALRFSGERRGTSPSLMLVGHAWSEVYDGTRFQVADAALRHADLVAMPGFSKLHYLPIQLLSREDAGFELGLVATVGVVQVKSARIGGGVASEPRRE